MHRKMKRPCEHGLCVWAALCAAPAFAQFGGPAKVTVAEVEVRPLPASTTLVGTVEPLTRAVIGSEIAGLVVEMPVREGDYVRRGDLLCKLKDATLSLQLAEAQETLKSLQADFRRWKFELERIQNLYGGQDASEKEVYDTQASHDRAQHEIARQRAVIDRLQTEIDKTRILAPFSGFIVRRDAELGEWVQTGGNVVELSDLSEVLVEINVPEKSIPYVHEGDPASVKIEALNQSFDGRIRHVLLQADPTARTFPVEVAVSNPGYVEQNGEMVPRKVIERRRGEDTGPATTKPSDDDGNASLLAGGMFARVTVKAGPDAMTPAVPKDAIVTRQGVDYVAMVTPGREPGSLMAAPMPVTTGLDIGNWIAVTSGNLPPGARVVTKGNENILYPSPIRIVEFGESTAMSDGSR